MPSSNCKPNPQKWIRWLKSRVRRQRAAAIIELCAAYEPLVKSMAMRYRQSALGGECEELEQVARLALTEACSTFDHARWKRGEDGLERLFAKHAAWSVRHALSEYVRSLANPVRLPGVIMDKLPQLRREQLRLANMLQREPTVEELTKAVGMPNGRYQRNSVAMVAAMLAYDEGGYSLDSETADEAIAVTTLTPEDVLLAKEERRELMRQRRIV